MKNRLADPRKISKEMRREVDRVSNVMYTVIAYELDRRNWKPETIETFLRSLDNTFDSIRTGRMSVNDISATLKKETGLEINVVKRKDKSII